MKYLNRIYILNQLGITLSNDESKIINEINRIVKLLNSFEYLKSHNGNSFLYTESKVYLEHVSERNEVNVYVNITNFKNKDDIIKFIFNNIFNLYTEKIRVNVKCPDGYYKTFKQIYL